jgi:hypothetical protein
VRARELTIALLRCPQCGDSQWLRDGIPVARAVAFSALAEAFEGVPESARAQRAASATRTAARRELREAAQAPVVRPPAAPRTQEDLLGALSGWKVLGASGQASQR